MTFLRPEFLYGLIALTIPIIIHLFNFRRHKKLYFSDISRLKNITVHTRKQQKLKHIIVLILRMLAILFIVLALAGIEPKKDNSGTLTRSGTIGLYIDNSFSMMAEGTMGRLFENARNDAIQIVEHSPSNASFIILSNSNKGQLNRVMNKEVAESELEKLEIVPNSKTLSQVITLRNQILKNSKLTSCETYILSDFQANTSNILNLPTDTVNNYYFIPFQHLQSKNIYIDSCAMNTPEISKDKVVKLSVWINNDSKTDYEKVPLKLLINNQQKAVAGIDIKAGTSKKVDLNFSVSKSGWQHGLIEIEDFPITFDDNLYFAFNVKKNIKVLIIETSDGDNKYLRDFYGSDDIFSVSEMSYRSIDFSILKESNLIILNAIPNISSGLTSNLKQYVTDGGNLLFIPANDNANNAVSFFISNMSAGTVTGFDTTNTRVNKLKLSDNIFSESVKKIPHNADLPSVNQHYIYNFPIASGVETLVSLLSGDDFLSKKNVGSGQIYLLSVGLNSSYGNFTSQLLFAPIMHGIASKSSAKQMLYYVLGKNNSISINIKNNNISESPYYLFSPANGESIIPRQTQNKGKLNLSLENINLQNGYYNLMMTDTTVAVLAFNYNRNESEMKFYNTNQVSKLCSRSRLEHYNVINPSDSKYTEIINVLQKESDFWKLFIIFALTVIFFEILILRFWK